MIIRARIHSWWAIEVFNLLIPRPLTDKAQPSQIIINNLIKIEWLYSLVHDCLCYVLCSMYRLQ